MKDKNWIIVLIMGIALTISIVYSIIMRVKANNAESTVTTTSIIEMTATTATIKNTLIGTGNITYKEIENNDNNEVKENNLIENTTTDQNNGEEENNLNENTVNESNIEKAYQIILTIDDKDFDKAKVGQPVEITIKKDEGNLIYTGTVIKINKDVNNKSTLDVKITNADEKIEENMTANCTVIIEKAENVVALPVEAIQKDDEGKSFVDVVKDDGTTEKIYIKTGISDDYYVEITDGLKVGDKVQIVKSSTTVVENNDKKNTQKNEI